MTIKIKLKNKKLSKNSGVRKWMRRVNEIVDKQFNTPGNMAAMAGAVMLGTPVIVHDDGKIEAVKDYYKTKE
ncbi:MAG: hypothetical protein AAB922_05370 [Patescibacteria group bacterium]